MEASKPVVLVVGATGMLGSEVFLAARNAGLHVFGTSRRELSLQLFPEEEFPRQLLLHMSTSEESIRNALHQAQPSAVINCLGVIKQAHGEEPLLREINEHFPHRLARCCDEIGARLICVSTDCVFSGKNGNYSEQDTPDPVDEYGASKLAGEVTRAPHLTIRTSIIGRERESSRSLLFWFVKQPANATVKGFTHAIWSGLTTQALSPILLDLAVGAHRNVQGLLHIASAPVSKYELLQLFQEQLRPDITVVADGTLHCDRSLAHERMDRLGITVPSIPEMVRALDPTTYR